MIVITAIYDSVSGVRHEWTTTHRLPVGHGGSAVISADGWYDWCERIPGPADKVYSQPNSAIMYLPHSAVGYYAGWASRLFSQERLANGRYTAYAAASVHLWMPQLPSEQPTQHYSIFSSCWASGSVYPNTNGIAAETAGGPPGNETEAYTPWQEECHARAICELADFKGWEPRRVQGEGDMAATIRLHRECKEFGSDPTACDSGRFDASGTMARVQALQEGDMAWTDAEKDKVLLLVDWFNAVWNGSDGSVDVRNQILFALTNMRQISVLTSKDKADIANIVADRLTAAGGGGQVNYALVAKGVLDAMSERLKT